MAKHQINPQGGRLTTLDPIWDRIRSEAEDIVHREPELATFIYSTVLHHDTLEAAVVYRLAERLNHAALSSGLIRQAYMDALRDEPSIGEIFRADIMATCDRDPATRRLIEPVLYYKGFHAIETHRLAHWLWDKGRRDFALHRGILVKAILLRLDDQGLAVNQLVQNHRIKRLLRNIARVRG